MADSDKNILITPNTGSTTNDPKIEFTGSDNNTVTLSTLSDGTLSVNGSAGQLFSISDDLTGTIFSVNDVSGIPSIEVDDTGEVRLAEFSGNVLIGTATDNGAKLQVSGDLNITGSYLVTANGTASTGGAIAIQQVTSEGWTGIFADFEPYAGWGIWHDNPNNRIIITSENSSNNLGSASVPSRYSGNRTAYYKMIFSQTNGDLQIGGSLSASGAVTAYASDKRLKENFKPIESPIEKIKALNGLYFDWKEDKIDELGFRPRIRKHEVGLIAQEVQAVLPQAVTLAPFDTEVKQTKVTPGDKNSDVVEELVSRSGENYLTVNYEKVVPLLVEAIKFQQQEIDDLKSIVSNLMDK